MRAPIRIVIVDDSAYNRQTIAALVEAEPGLQVVGRAADGDEALRLVVELAPDLVLLDLEMPKMDGFTFLRLLPSLKGARRPTPVLVVSGLGSHDNVMKALSLGALDFVAKPSRRIGPQLREIQRELVDKIRMVARLRPLERDAGAPEPIAVEKTPVRQTPPAQPQVTGLRVVAIGASTGGPPALLQLLGAMTPQPGTALLITQHMPPRFTRAFADRLARLTPFPMREASDGDLVEPGTALVAPGSGSMVLAVEDGRVRVRLDARTPDGGFRPSIDRMFESAADALGPGVLAVVLTGMAGDGSRGARAIKARGGRVLAESPSTAVLPTMPSEAIATGAVDEVLPLGELPAAIARFLAG